MKVQIDLIDEWAMRPGQFETEVIRALALRTMHRQNPPKTGKTYAQPLQIKMDPRVKTSVKELEAIHELAFICYEGRQTCMQALEKIQQTHYRHRYLSCLEMNLEI